jgi:hypothetical protein
MTAQTSLPMDNCSCKPRASIIVRGVQEAWRTGELADDEREEDAIEKLVELYPELDEDDLRRIVKSAVYLLRLSAGKQVDRVMEHVPEPQLSSTGTTIRVAGEFDNLGGRGQ